MHISQLIEILPVDQDRFFGRLEPLRRRVNLAGFAPGPRDPTAKNLPKIQLLLDSLRAGQYTPHEDRPSGNIELRSFHPIERLQVASEPFGADDELVHQDIAEEAI